MGPLAVFAPTIENPLKDDLFLKQIESIRSYTFKIPIFT